MQTLVILAEIDATSAWLPETLMQTLWIQIPSLVDVNPQKMSKVPKDDRETQAFILATALALCAANARCLDPLEFASWVASVYEYAYDWKSLEVKTGALMCARAIARLPDHLLYEGVHRDDEDDDDDSDSDSDVIVADSVYVSTMSQLRESQKSLLGRNASSSSRPSPEKMLARVIELGTPLRRNSSVYSAAHEIGDGSPLGLFQNDRSLLKNQRTESVYTFFVDEDQVVSDVLGDLDAAAITAACVPYLVKCVAYGGDSSEINLRPKALDLWAEYESARCVHVAEAHGRRELRRTSRFNRPLLLALLSSGMTSNPPAAGVVLAHAALVRDRRANELCHGSSPRARLPSRRSHRCAEYSATLVLTRVGASVVQRRDGFWRGVCRAIRSDVPDPRRR